MNKSLKKRLYKEEYTVLKSLFGRQFKWSVNIQDEVFRLKLKNGIIVCFYTPQEGKKLIIRRPRNLSRAAFGTLEKLIHNTLIKIL